MDEVLRSALDKTALVCVKRNSKKDSTKKNTEKKKKRKGRAAMRVPLGLGLPGAPRSKSPGSPSYRRPKHPPAHWMRLYELGYPLHGKKRALFPIYKVDATDPRRFEIYPPGAKIPVPGRGARESMFLLALVHSIGFPDAGDRDLLADCIYLDLRLVLECDEEQHYDMKHPFNVLKPTYQRPRDRRISEHFARLGFYVVRVKACDGPDEAGRFAAISPEETYKRTAVAVREQLEIRRRNYAAGDFGGKVLVFPDDASRSMARTYFHSDEIESEAARLQPTEDSDRARLRGTILAQELASREAAKIVAQTVDSSLAVASSESDDSSDSDDDDALGAEEKVASVPEAKAAGWSIAEAFSRTLSIGGDRASPGGSSGAYESHWRSILDKYSPADRYQERVSRIDLELLSYASRASTVRP